MNEEMLQQLAEVFMQVMAQQGQEISPEQAVQQVSQLASAAQQGDEKATQMLQQLVQVAQQMGQQQQAIAARHGAKLNYVRLLNNIVPEGYEIQYRKCGGTMKKKIKKSQNGNEFRPGISKPQQPRINKVSFQATPQQKQAVADKNAAAQRNRNIVANQKQEELRRQQAQQQKRAAEEKAIREQSMKRQNATNERNARIKAAQEANRQKQAAADAARAKQRQQNSQARQAQRNSASNQIKSGVKQYYNNTSIGRMLPWKQNGGTIPYYVMKHDQKFV